METGIQRARTLLAREDDSAETLAAIEVALACVEKRMEPETAIQMIGEAWIGEEALGVAIYCSLMVDDFASGVRMSVNHDGDSDTTGLLVGQLLGAIHGEAAIPAHWLSDLEGQEIIRRMADDLCDCFQWKLDDQNQAKKILD